MGDFETDRTREIVKNLIAIYASIEEPLVGHIVDVQRKNRFRIQLVTHNDIGTPEGRQKKAVSGIAGTCAAVVYPSSDLQTLQWRLVFERVPSEKRIGIFWLGALNETVRMCDRYPARGKI